MKLRSLAVDLAISVALTAGLVGLVEYDEPHKRVSHTGVLGNKHSLPGNKVALYDFKIGSVNYYLSTNQVTAPRIDFLTDYGDTVTVNVDTFFELAPHELGEFTAADISNIRRPVN
nr:hypothetical protein [Nanoarchaeum sp.]